MQHLEDRIYKGHELVIMQEGDDGSYVVDIRIDDYDGEFIGGYYGIATREEAIEKGKAFVDGYEEAKASLAAKVR
jgi:antibiotic biosynthesis monooxygenase (ABM) superfamily enzyme